MWNHLCHPTRVHFISLIYLRVIKVLVAPFLLFSKGMKKFEFRMLTKYVERNPHFAWWLNIDFRWGENICNSVQAWKGIRVMATLLCRKQEFVDIKHNRTYSQWEGRGKPSIPANIEKQQQNQKYNCKKLLTSCNYQLIVHWILFMSTR